MMDSKSWKQLGQKLYVKGKDFRSRSVQCIFNGIPASSKGFCLDPRDGVWAPLSSIQHPLEDPGNHFRVFSMGHKSSLWDVIVRQS